MALFVQLLTDMCEALDTLPVITLVYIHSWIVVRIKYKFHFIHQAPKNTQSCEIKEMGLISIYQCILRNCLAFLFSINR